jgi:hypothetical protein
MRSASLLILDVTDPNGVTSVSLLPVGISGDEQNPDGLVAEPERVAILLAIPTWRRRRHKCKWT